MGIRRYIQRLLKYLLHGIPIVTVKANITTLSPNGLLVGKSALITGGTSGIGFEIAKSFLQAGATVIITGRDIVRLKTSCQKLSEYCVEGALIDGVVLDNKNPESFKGVLGNIIARLQGKQLDILVNNAGVVGGHISNCKIDEYDAVMDTNLRGVFFLSQEVGRYMRDNSVQGNILNIASSSSLRPASSAYTLSKWGIRGLTLGLARMLAPYGITVNGLAPGPTATPMLGKRNIDDLYFEKNPLGRYALPSEIGNMAVILVSNLSKTIIGDIVYMTGGAGTVYNEDMDWRF